MKCSFTIFKIVVFEVIWKLQWCLFDKVEDPADLDIVKNAVSSSSGLKEEKPIDQSTKSEVEALKTTVTRISPSAKVLIAEHGLDISSLKASGHYGTLLKGDVLAAIKSGVKSSKVPSSKEKTVPSPTASTESKSHLRQSDFFEDLPNSQIRKVCLLYLTVGSQGCLY